MKKLGVIGGLGPMASALFLEMVTEMTEARTDQEHIEILLHSCPWIPDRTQYILGKRKENPVKPMADMGIKLAQNGADIIAIPCITAGYFYSELSEAIPVPVIHTLEEIAKYLQKLGVQRVGLMATDGTVAGGFLQRTLEQSDIKVLLPSKGRQQDVMHLIYQEVKAGKHPEAERFDGVTEELKEKGAQVVLLGCTELSVIGQKIPLKPGCLDAMRVLAKRAVELCGVLHPRWQYLITADSEGVKTQ